MPPPHRSRFAGSSCTEERSVRGVPASLIWRADQATREVGRVIWPTVKMGAVSASLAVKQPSRRMIPGHEPVVDQKVAVTRGRHAILVRCAAQPKVHPDARQVGDTVLRSGSGRKFVPATACISAGGTAAATRRSFVVPSSASNQAPSPRRAYAQSWHTGS